MSILQLNKLFADSFDTFKVLDNLTVEETGRNSWPVPSTIWQILNHLICWQEHQLYALRNTATEKNISEIETWITTENTDSQERLDNRVAKFKKQLSEIQEEINRLTTSDSETPNKLKIIQDATVHLSFHISEIILMRRMAGNYPLPHQMKEFLN